MSAAAKGLKAGDILFREGDTSGSMFVVKKGRLIVVKAKGSTEIELAEIGAGEMIGEMAFFDKKPRSATVKAKLDTEVIELPFSSLQTQFDAMPEWVKSIIKTINEHLRDANKRIKNLEQAQPGGGRAGGLSHYQANKLASLIMFVASKWGTACPEGTEVPPGQLRKFTIQVFQEPTNKMQTMLSVLQGMGYAKVEDLGEGKQRVVVTNVGFMEGFVEWYTDYLFADEDKRVTVAKDELKLVAAALYFGKKAKPDDKGVVKINLLEVQNESMKALGYLVSINDFNKLISKGVLSEKMQTNEATFTSFHCADLEKIYPYFQLYYAIESTGA